MTEKEEVEEECQRPNPGGKKMSLTHIGRIFRYSCSSDAGSRKTRKARAAGVHKEAIFVDVTTEPKEVSALRERPGRQVSKLSKGLTQTLRHTYIQEAEENKWQHIRSCLGGTPPGSPSGRSAVRATAGTAGKGLWERTHHW